MLLLYVAAGGAFGSMCRYLMVQWVNGLLGKQFPYGTLVVNLLGSFLMGIALALVVSMLPRGRELYALLAVGALGGFTTFSAFSYDTYMLLEKGLLWQALLYIVASVIGSVLAFFFGMYAFKAVWMH